MCTRSWFVVGMEMKTFFPLLMCCLFFLVDVWCQTMGSPCGLPHQPAASCASMNVKEKHISEISIPEKKMRNQTERTKLGAVYFFSWEILSWPLWESWKSKQSSPSDFLRVLFFFLNIIFFPSCLDFKTVSCTDQNHWTSVCVMSL